MSALVGVWVCRCGVRGGVSLLVMGYSSLLAIDVQTVSRGLFYVSP